MYRSSTPSTASVASDTRAGIPNCHKGRIVGAIAVLVAWILVIYILFDRRIIVL
jgi:hypothetical protein